MRRIVIKRALILTVFTSTFAFADYNCEIGSPSGVVQETVLIQNGRGTFRKDIEGLNVSLLSASLPNGLQELGVKIIDPVSGNVADSLSENVAMNISLKRATDAYATRISCVPLNN